MSVPYKKETPVRLREMFSSDYKLITILPSFSSFDFRDIVENDLDDVLFARYKDILIDPERYLSTLDHWFSSHIEEFERICFTLLEKYDPLSNYNMLEKEGEISKEGEKVSEAKRYGTDKTTQTIPDTKTSRYTTTFDNAAEGRLDSYNIQEVQEAPTLDGYNAQITAVTQEADGQGRQGSELTEKYNGEVTIKAPDGDLEGDRGSLRELSREGNIGVTTSQQMLEAEIDIRVKYSFIDIFCKMFAEDMTIGVWEL